VSVQVTDTDRGLNSRVDALRDFARYEVVVGVLGDRGGDRAEPGSDLTVLDVAIIHEFGAPDADPPIPERSFVRAYVDENHDQIRAWLRAGVARVFAGAITVRQAFETLGAQVAAGIQARIAAGIDPPLADSTVERKGSSVPLIDTGQLRSSVTYLVREKGART
jgi:hypothetical protein